MVPEVDPKDREKVADKTFRQRSPRGLIENVGEIRKWVWPRQGREELASLIDYLNAQKDPVADYLRFWRESATTIINRSGKKPKDYRLLAESETLDHVCLAARVLKQLDKIETYIALAERDPELFRGALGEALFLSVLTHHLTVVDNETSIWKGEDNKTLRENAAQRTNHGHQNRQSYQSRADAIWQRNPKLNKAEVARRIEHGERANEGTATEKLKANSIRRLIRKK